MLCLHYVDSSFASEVKETETNHDDDVRPMR